MIKLINFIESNLVEFESLSDSEMLEYDSSEFDKETIRYLRLRVEYFYKNICVFYWFENNKIYVEKCV